MSVDLLKYNYHFLTSPTIDYEKELKQITTEKHLRQVQGDETQSNELWRIEKRISIYAKYAELYRLLKEGEFYNAWCTAEQIEIGIGNLMFNFPNDKHIVAPILTRVHKLQQLFPYRAFSSTEVVVKEYTCSICGAKSSPRSRCGHQLRKVYNGEMCHHTVTKAELLGLSIVTNPEHKYAVLFPAGDKGKKTDTFDYSIVKALVSIWKKPFQLWDYTITTSYIPKTEDFKPDSFCPCNSGKDYKDCCMDKPGIRHLHISFSPNMSIRRGDK